MDFDYQHSINGSLNATIIDGKYTKTISIAKGHSFVGMKLLSQEHVKETNVKKNDDGNIEVSVIYNESYIESIGYTWMANVYVYYEFGVEEETIPLEEIENNNDEFKWRGDSIQINSTFKKSVGITPTIVIFFKFGCAL